MLEYVIVECFLISKYPILTKIFFKNNEKRGDCATEKSQNLP